VSLCEIQQTNLPSAYGQTCRTRTRDSVSSSTRVQFSRGSDSRVEDSTTSLPTAHPLNTTPSLSISLRVLGLSLYTFMIFIPIFSSIPIACRCRCPIQLLTSAQPCCLSVLVNFFLLALTLDLCFSTWSHPFISALVYICFTYVRCVRNHKISARLLCFIYVATLM
jgi:hypothetical protein